jgi:hypothetical protein
MAETVPRASIRDRLGDLDTKGYYLLVALSFIYRSGSTSFLLKLAFSLTAAAVIPPIQDATESAFWLKRIRDTKIALLMGGLACALVWIWATQG